MALAASRGSNDACTSAPERLHEEITADYTDMIYAATPEAVAARRKAFIRKWRLKHRAVADSLEEAGARRAGAHDPRRVAHHLGHRHQAEVGIAKAGRGVRPSHGLPLVFRGSIVAAWSRPPRVQLAGW